MGIGAGYLAAIAYAAVFGFPIPFLAADAALLRETILGSVIAALVLREPRLAHGQQFSQAGQIYSALCQRGAAAVAILLSVGLATRALSDVARLWVFGWAVLFTVWIAGSRWGLVSYASRLVSRGSLREAVAVMGAPGLAERLAARLSREAEVVAVFGGLEDLDGIALEQALEDVRELASAGLIDTVVVAMSADDDGDAAGLLQQLKAVPAQVTICNEPMPEAPASMSFRIIGGVPLTVVADRPLKRWDLLLKAGLDRLGALLLLVALAPLMLGVAIVIMADSPGPVIFRQPRRGWCGRVFTIYKFRTMHDAANNFPLRQTARNDPRCTRVGTFLRNSSFDELPQLWNVLCGDMSLVGPRPHPEAMHDLQQAGCQIVAEYAQRQRVKPGMTGWAQIHGLRGAVNTPEQMRRRVQSDLYYIDNWSVWLDLYVLACTPVSMLRAENAY